MSPALVVGRLWETQELPAILRRLADGRRFGFDVERATFALALQRLCAPGSDLQEAQDLLARVVGVDEAELEAPALENLGDEVAWLVGLWRDADYADGLAGLEGALYVFVFSKDWHENILAVMR